MDVDRVLQIYICRIKTDPINAGPKIVLIINPDSNVTGSEIATESITSRIVSFFILE